MSISAGGGRRGLPQLDPFAQEMRMLANIKILPRLFIGFGILVLLIAGLSGFAIYSGQTSRTVFENVTRLKSAETLGQRVERRMFEARMQIWMALATDDQAHLGNAHKLALHMLISG
jgi:hypothetical protein